MMIHAAVSTIVAAARATTLLRLLLVVAALSAVSSTVSAAPTDTCVRPTTGSYGPSGSRQSFHWALSDDGRTLLHTANSGVWVNDELVTLPGTAGMRPDGVACSSTGETCVIMVTNLDNVTPNRFFRSGDFGQTWADHTPAGQVATSVNALGLNRSGQHGVLVTMSYNGVKCQFGAGGGGCGGEIWLTHDFGMTWTKSAFNEVGAVGGPLQNNYMSVENASNLRGFVSDDGQRITIPCRVIDTLGDDPVVVTSSDGGATFVVSAFRAAPRHYTSDLWVSADGVHVASMHWLNHAGVSTLTTYNTVYWSHDGGVTFDAGTDVWPASTAPMNNVQLHQIRFFACDDDNHLNCYATTSAVGNLGPDNDNAMILHSPDGFKSTGVLVDYIDNNNRNQWWWGMQVSGSYATTMDVYGTRQLRVSTDDGATWSWNFAKTTTATADVSGCFQTGQFTAAECHATCLATGAAVAACAMSGAVMTITGCSAGTCTAPAPTPGYDLSGCSGGTGIADCALVCDASQFAFGASPSALCPAGGGVPFVAGGCVLCDAGTFYCATTASCVPDCGNNACPATPTGVPSSRLCVRAPGAGCAPGTVFCAATDACVSSCATECAGAPTIATSAQTCVAQLRCDAAYRCPAHRKYVTDPDKVGAACATSPCAAETCCQRDTVGKSVLYVADDDASVLLGTEPRLVRAWSDEGRAMVRGAGSAADSMHTVDIVAMKTQIAEVRMELRCLKLCKTYVPGVACTGVSACE